MFRIQHSNRTRKWMSMNHTCWNISNADQVSRSSAKKAAVSSASSTPSKCGLNPTLPSNRLPSSKGLGIPGLPHSSAPSRSSSTSFRSEASWSEMTKWRWQEVKQWILVHETLFFESISHPEGDPLPAQWCTLRPWKHDHLSRHLWISWAFQHISMHLKQQTSVSTPFSAKGALAPSVFSAVLGKAMRKMKRWRVTKTRATARPPRKRQRSFGRPFQAIQEYRDKTVAP